MRVGKATRRHPCRGRRRRRRQEGEWALWAGTSSAMLVGRAEMLRARWRKSARAAWTCGESAIRPSTTCAQKATCKVGEKPSVTREGELHAAEFAKEALPLFESDAATAVEVVKDGKEAGGAMGGQVDGLGQGIDVPAQEGLESGETSVALGELLLGDGFATGVVKMVVWAKNVVDRVEEGSEDAAKAGGRDLGGDAEIVNENVDVGNRGAAGETSKTRGRNGQQAAQDSMSWAVSRREGEEVRRRVAERL